MSCIICGDDLNKHFCITLNCACKSTYHYDCIFNTLKNDKYRKCPYCSTIDMKLPLVNGLKKVDKIITRDLSTRLKYTILSVDGDYEKSTIRNFVDNRFLALEAREFRKYVAQIQPSVDLSFDYKDDEGNITKIDIPVGLNFFWPDATI